MEHMSFAGEVGHQPHFTKAIVFAFEEEFITRRGQKMGNACHYEARRLHRENGYVRGAARVAKAGGGTARCVERLMGRAA